MGICHSTHNNGFNDSEPLSPRVVERKRSIALSHLASTALSAHSQETIVSHSEKGLPVPTKDHYISLPPPLFDERFITPNLVQGDSATAYKSFLRQHPEYKLTWLLDSLRKSDFTRLEKSGEVYVDYMGGSLYPESLVRMHSAFLQENVLGNTHSVSNSAQLSADCMQEARESVLAFFRAPPEYTVVFTANATAALKLVGESFPFTENGTYVLGADSHNSLHGIREFSYKAGSHVVYIESTSQGGLNEPYAKSVLMTHRPRSKGDAKALFALTGTSNISNSKNPLSLIQYASSLGYSTLLDAAALAPHSIISLWETPVDAMAVSFYKMFGFPTGIGALVVKKSFLSQLKRPWFSGGNVNVVQVPGKLVTRSHELHEQFEDGTVNYTLLSAVTDGLRLLSAYMPFLPLRLSCLTTYLVSSLLKIRHDSTGRPVVCILSRRPNTRLKAIGEQAETASTVSLIFLSPSGETIPNSFIEYAATASKISLRTGCMCNSGGAAAILGIASDMKKLYEGVTLKDFERLVGRELGVVRISLGLVSNFLDVWRVLRFVEDIIGCQARREDVWEQWKKEKGITEGADARQVGQAL
ncbi:PLP-dependent transferase [Thelephora ganbajun]|uniref:PLP-dependent transferase n=1 Tax=Thelephora ganbajun TaxID=370292 RepID=A0ACB6ZIT1_THEGA|nr:PLP-dependent transferase [Thelephora ganbajun]